MATKTTRTRTAKESVQSEVPNNEKTTRSTSVNKVTLVGRLVAAPEMRTTGSGLHVTTVRVVTNDRETPEFHDVVLWRQLADFAVNYVAKGRLVYIEGRLHSRSWEAADGTKRRTDEVVADPSAGLVISRDVELTCRNRRERMTEHAAEGVHEV